MSIRVKVKKNRKKKKIPQTQRPLGETKKEVNILLQYRGRVITIILTGVLH